jgi:APA family basic amino acid/polyamine antiporter
MPQETPIITEPQEFKKELGLLDSTLLVVGSMIGSGIFIVSADIARTVGSAGWLLLVWVITGVITVAAALSYGELAAMMPKAGGQYVYLKEAWNPLIGFLYGWTLFLVIQTGTIAAVAVAFAKFTGIILPIFSEKNIILSYLKYKISAAQILAIVSIWVLTLINLKGIKIGKVVQNIFTGTKTVALFLLIILGLLLGADSYAYHINLKDFWTPTWTHIEGDNIINVQTLTGLSIIAAVGVAMVGSVFSADAWNNITFTAAEIKDPRKNIPRSLFLGTLIVTILYLLANLSYIFVLPVKGNPNGTTAFERGIQFALNDRVGAAAVSVFLGETAAIVMALLIMISTFGCNNGLILSGARVTYAMSRDNLFFKNMSHLNNNAVPGNALVLQAIWASILCLSGTYSDLLDYVVFAVMIFYILTILGLFRLRFTKPEIPRPYKAFGYPIVPALYILIALVFAIILLIYKPQYTYPGVAIVLIGIPVYYIWQAKKK